MGLKEMANNFLDKEIFRALDYVGVRELCDHEEYKRLLGLISGTQNYFNAYLSNLKLGSGHKDQDFAMQQLISYQNWMIIKQLNQMNENLVALTKALAKQEPPAGE